jgi:hypothetical protein
MGDFNYWGIDWDEMGQGNLRCGCAEHKEFLELLDDNFIPQNVNLKTFQTDDGVFTNTLDLLLTETSDRINLDSVMPPLGDLLVKAHVVLNFSYKLRSSLNCQSEYKKAKLAYTRANYEKMNDEFESTDWQAMFVGCNTQECYTKFLKVYATTCDKFIPTVKTGNKINPCKWMTPTLKKIRKKLKLWHLNQRVKWRIVSKKNEFIELKKDVDKEVMTRIKEFEMDIARSAKNNPKLVYQYVNSKKRSRMKSVR